MIVCLHIVVFMLLYFILIKFFGCCDFSLLKFNFNFIEIGSARTSLIVTIGPSARHHAETASTIMFGQRVCWIKLYNVEILDFYHNL